MIHMWIMVCYAEPVVMYLDVRCWASGCETWCVIPRQWLWIMVSYDKPVVVNLGEVCWDSGCESRCYDESVVVNRGELCWAYGCESWCAMLSQWLWIKVSFAEPVILNHGVLCWASGYVSCMIHNHWRSIIYHDSQPLAQSNRPWFTTTSSA
jgi:hypothetical protein